MTRIYNMTKRSRQAAQTTADVIAATEALLVEKPMAEVTLKSIASTAGITVQTVLRHMGSRDGCIKAVVQSVTARVEEQRGNSDYSSIEMAISDLIEHYESEGKLILSFLTQEQGGDSFVIDLMQAGRLYHRNWVKRCFAEHLNRHGETVIDALVVATDIYTWKLLRLDLCRSRNAAMEVITNIVKKTLEVS